MATHRRIKARVMVSTVSDLLTPDECGAFIALTEARGLEAAPITTGRGFEVRPEIRNNRRVMIDDVDRANSLWEKIAPFVPAELGRFTVLGLNERFRYYRYEEGQYFRWHADGCFRRSSEEESLLTLMVYLNDDFEGGATEMEGDVVITPRAGMALLFEHAIVHQGAPITKGRKYVLRSDVMYQRKPSPGGAGPLRQSSCRLDRPA